MTSCALPKTESVGDDLQSTALRSTDDDHRQRCLQLGGGGYKWGAYRRQLTVLKERGKLK